MTRVDLEDDWTPHDDLVALHTAEDAGELHRRLLLFASGGGNRADAFEPWCLVHKFHAAEPEGAVVTAVLLLTDRRWCNATGRLVRRIEESGLVPDEELDVLAQTFLAAGPQVYWEAPGDWFGGPAIVNDFGHEGADDEPDSEELADDAGDAPIVVARDVRPPLRRWAAGRVVRAEPASWGALVKRARELDARSGAAIVRGIVDGIDGVDSLAPAARSAVLELAARWPQRDVRDAAAAITARRGATDTSPPCVAPVARTEREPTQAQASLF